LDEGDAHVRAEGSIVAVARDEAPLAADAGATLTDDPVGRRELSRRAVDNLRATRGARRPDRIETLAQLGEVELAGGDASAARSACEEAPVQATAAGRSEDDTAALQERIAKASRP
jgi:hypothetical protein